MDVVKRLFYAVYTHGKQGCKSEKLPNMTHIKRGHLLSISFLAKKLPTKAVTVSDHLLSGR